MIRCGEFMAALLASVGFATVAQAQLDYRIPEEQYPETLPPAAPFTLTHGDTVFVGHSAVGASKTLSFTIYAGGAGATLDRIAFSGDAMADYRSPTATPGASGSFDVVFTPRVDFEALGFDKYRGTKPYRSAKRRVSRDFGIREKEYMRRYLLHYRLTARLSPACFHWRDDEAAKARKHSSIWRN